MAHSVFKSLLIAAPLAFAVTACVTPTTELPSVARNQIKVAESIERLELYPNRHGMDLSPRDRQAMAQFLGSYAREGDGPIYLNRPASGGGGIQSASAQVRNTLSAIGLGGVAVQEGVYPSAPGSPAPLVVSYRRLKTIVPDCRVGYDLTRTGTNTPAPDWGCAYHANIAAMVADPNQFLAPYPLGPSEPQRDMVIYEKYINGEQTAATRPGDQIISSQETGG